MVSKGAIVKTKDTNSSANEPDMVQAKTCNNSRLLCKKTKKQKNKTEIM